MENRQDSFNLIKSSKNQNEGYLFYLQKAKSLFISKAPLKETEWETRDSENPHFSLFSVTHEKVAGNNESSKKQSPRNAI